MVETKAGTGLGGKDLEHLIAFRARSEVCPGIEVRDWRMY